MERMYHKNDVIVRRCVAGSRFKFDWH